jgi:A/G-specific adenine glycosylase
MTNSKSKIKNQKAAISHRLRRWFQQRARDLPWRRDRSPYRVWLSEMMLQQTQVETVIPYFNRFLDRFPTLNDLAAAPLGDVLKVWEGLGYYARARNLHRTAIEIVNARRGEWPRTVEGLIALPGIGRYSAGAIASLAFNVDAPVLDGNVIRVLGRLFAIKRDPRQPRVRAELWSLAEALLPKGHAGEFNEALMELGATICTPRAPKCDVCPIAKFCEANQRGLQDRLPIKSKRKPLPHYDVTAAVIRRNGRVLIAQRPLGGRLGGLWEFPGGKQERGETLPQCLRREIKEELGLRIKVGRLITTVEHAYTHFKITLHAFECEVQSGRAQALQVEDFKWVRMSELDRYAFAKTDLKIIERLRGEG